MVRYALVYRFDAGGYLRVPEAIEEDAIQFYRKLGYDVIITDSDMLTQQIADARQADEDRWKQYGD